MRSRLKLARLIILSLYFEIGFTVMQRLPFDVGFDHLVGDLARTSAEVTPTPQMSAPVPLAQGRKFHRQFPRGSTFQRLDHPADRQRRWCRDEQVDVVFAHMALQNVHIVGQTGLPDQLPYPIGDLALQDVIPILRRPYDVVLQTVDRVGP